MRIALALVLLTAAAGTTAAGDHNEVSVTESARALRSSSANAITEDGLFGVTFTYARRLDVRPVPALEIWSHGSFGFGIANGMMFQTLTTELDTLSLTVGGGARYALRRRIVATARIEVGAARAALQIRDEAGHSASDAGWGFITSTAVGMDLYAIRGQRFTLGLRFELGAVATSSIPLTAMPGQRDENMLELDMTAASLGELNLSGPTFAASLVGQF
jgi:hypothetical protein